MAIPSRERPILLNPGPVGLSERVRQALTRKDLCHREQDYRDLQLDVQARLAAVYYETKADYLAVPLCGSGTAAVEAMVGSIVPRGGKVLVLANGVYGERIAEILERQGKPYELLRWGWTEPLDVETAGAALRSGTGFTHVAAVHLETTTGRLNDLAALGALCRAERVGLLVDAVSSFGAEKIQFEAWAVEACAAAANKCLHGAPGVSFVLVHRAALQRESASASFYLDLWRHAAGASSGEPPFTPPVHVLLALREALCELEESGGWSRRREAYQALIEQAARRLNALGFETLLQEQSAISPVIRAFRLPWGMDYTSLHDCLRDAGFVIYSGQGSLLGKIFRISTMGNICAADIERFLESVESIMLSRRTEQGIL